MLAACAVLTACAASAPSPPRSTPQPTETGDIRLAPVALATGWSARATLDRRDSIVITLPNGTRQVQRLARRATFRLDVDGRGGVRIVLDSLSFTPSAGVAEREAQGTIWTGELGRAGLGRLRPSRRSPVIDELTGTMQGMFPVMPRSGVRPGMTWADTSQAERRVQAFVAADNRTGTWAAGQRTMREGLEVQPISAREQFEQIGEAETGGQQMKMTAQGRRSSTYYLTVGGRIDMVTHQDSVAMLITILARRETIPTMQQIRTTIRFHDQP